MSASTPTFFNLWPTQLMEITLPGSDQANMLLAQFLQDLDQQAEQMTTDYLSTNLFDQGHPALMWLHQSCQRAVVDYAAQLGIDYSLDFLIQGWANINRLGDYHNLHNHPHSWLSGTYYVSIPEHDSLPPGRDDRTPNCISFYDPRPQANMTAIRGDGEVDPEHRVKPVPGMLLLWPAFLHHLVHPNLSHEPRVSVSFNVVLRWKEEYLP
jgi:uncharacterized protein (TIGR02466 family)